MLLALATWLGALIFFPFVAQTAFTSLPSHSAGIIVRSSLIRLHSIAFACGVAFLAASLTYNRVALGRVRVLSASHLFLIVMVVLTAISQFRIMPRMDALRLAAGEISTLPPYEPMRAQFDSLHTWSTRIEEMILVLGLIVLYLTCRQIAERP